MPKKTFVPKNPYFLWARTRSPGLHRLNYEFNLKTTIHPFPVIYLVYIYNKITN